MTDDGSTTLTLEQALRLAVEAHRGGQRDRAAAIYGQILAQAPDNGDALHLLGLLEMDRGRDDEAERLLRRAVELNPETPAFKASLGKALYLAGRTEEGLVHASRALADDPRNPGIREVAYRLLRPEPSLELLRLPGPLEPVQATAAPAAEKRMVIGLATGYPAAALLPFVLSLRAHYDGPVHLIVDRDDETAAFLDAQRIDWSLATPGTAHPVLRRFALYRDLIASVDGQTRLLLTDVSDVIFQGDPFGFSCDAPLACVLEDASMTLGTCPWNSDWLRTDFGNAMLDRLSDRRISCIGTIFGYRDALAHYLTQFCLMAASLPVPGIYGLDTAIHNVLLHHGTVAGMIALENGWPVATVQHMAEHSIVVDDDGIRLADHRHPLVVHQYNRRAAMIALVERRYGNLRENK